MRPSICGYVRLVVGSDSPNESERIKAELSAFAEREGFSLDEVFIESFGARDTAFDVLIERLKSSDIRNVLVPSLWHFARVPGLQEAMQQHIQRETGAQIWVVQGQRR